MKFLMIWETAIKAIQKNSRRSFLTVLGIIIGTAAVITVVSVGRGYERYQIQKMLGTEEGTLQTRISFSPKDGSVQNSSLEYFSTEDIENIKQIAGVLAVETEQEDADRMYRSKTVAIKSYSESLQMKLRQSLGKTIVYGRGLKESDHINRNKVVVLSSIVAEEIDSNPESLIGKHLTIDSESFKIIGIYSGTYSDLEKIEVPQATYQRYWGNDKEKKLVVTLSNDYSSATIGGLVTKYLSESGSLKRLGTYKASNDASYIDSISGMLQSLTLLISFVGAISLFISGVGVMNMIYTSVSERTKEIGIRRSLGASARNIQFQFLLEGVSLTLLGGVIGYLLGLLFAKIISLGMGFTFRPDLFTAGLAISISVGIGLFFSYFPSKSATEKDIVELVR